MMTISVKAKCWTFNVHIHTARVRHSCLCDHQRASFQIRISGFWCLTKMSYRKELQAGIRNLVSNIANDDDWLEYVRRNCFLWTGFSEINMPSVINAWSSLDTVFKRYVHFVLSDLVFSILLSVGRSETFQLC